MNRLKDSTSPYLLQHADNPVDWWPWCDEAFAEAARRDVPVMLSVGYAACHWCHVMAHESFEDPQTAALLNEHVVAVKVDREERPDVDSVYMTATQAMTGQGGWPMTVFMTPDQEPFFCGTYFPRDTFRQLIAERRAGLAHPARRRDRPGQAGRRRPGRQRGRGHPRAARPPAPGSRAVSAGHRRIGARTGTATTTRPKAGSARRRSSRRPWWLEFLLRSLPAYRVAGRAGHGRGDLRGHGPRRHVRPARRRFRPVLDGLGLGHTALREDAVRQRAAGPGLPEPVARHRVRAGPPGGRRDLRVAGGRAEHARGRPRRLAGRRQRG